MAAQRDPAPNGDFVNDLHAPSLCFKPDPPQGPPDPLPGGPALVPPDQASLDQGLRGPDCLAMEDTTSAATMPTTDSDWRPPCKPTSLMRSSQPIELRREGLPDVPRRKSPSTVSFTSEAHRRWEC
jgi:hypothetical protein